MPGLLEKLSEMNSQLEEIQKSLDMYLETKRQVFPRFYFLSNDDLLEILGQSRNPNAVQAHLKKCFDNIKSLRLSKVHPHTLNSQIRKEIIELDSYPHDLPLQVRRKYSAYCVWLRPVLCNTNESVCV